MRLAARQLAYGYPGRVLGRDVDFSLASGEVVCVLGPNGGGKTTLFRTLLGLLPALGGEVLLDDASLARQSRRALARTLGYVPQQHASYFNFTVKEMVLMGRTAHIGAFATPGPPDHAATERALEALGIAHLADRICTRVSGGERQLALLARALAQGPQLLVMDEPTASLDFGNQTLVLQRIRDLATTGIGIVFSTHDPDQAFLCAERVLLLRDGVLAEGAPNQTITRENLKRLYDADIDVVDLPPPHRGRACVPAFGATR